MNDTKMKKPFITICALGFALASCGGKSNQNLADSLKADSLKMDNEHAAATNSPAQNMEYCFVHTDGTAGQDTTAVHLTIKSGTVAGEMNWLPKEKDRRKGTLAGTLNGDKIKAVWSFMQEGQTDTLGVAFKLSSQQLLQKPLVVDTKTGRQQTDAKADYTVVFNMDNCDKFRK